MERGAPRGGVGSVAQKFCTGIAKRTVGIKNVNLHLAIDQNVGVDTESAKAREERNEEGGERELGPGKDAEFRESQETMRWQEMKNL